MPNHKHNGTQHLDEAHELEEYQAPLTRFRTSQRKGASIGRIPNCSKVKKTSNDLGAASGWHQPITMIPSKTVSRRNGNTNELRLVPSLRSSSTVDRCVRMCSTKRKAAPRCKKSSTRKKFKPMNSKNSLPRQNGNSLRRIRLRNHDQGYLKPPVLTIQLRPRETLMPFRSLTQLTNLQKSKPVKRYTRKKNKVFRAVISSVSVSQSAPQITNCNRTSTDCHPGNSQSLLHGKEILLNEDASSLSMIRKQKSSTCTGDCGCTTHSHPTENVSIAVQTCGTQTHDDSINSPDPCQEPSQPLTRNPKERQADVVEDRSEEQNNTSPPTGSTVEQTFELPELVSTCRTNQTNINIDKDVKTDPTSIVPFSGSSEGDPNVNENEDNVEERKHSDPRGKRAFPEFYIDFLLAFLGL